MELNAEVLTEEAYKKLRTKLISHIEVLDKVKEIIYLPNSNKVTTNQAADYYDVSIKTIQASLSRNRDEFISVGCYISRGHDLDIIKSICKENNLKTKMGTPYISNKCKAVTILTNQGLLLLGMLLKRSSIAKKVRQYLIKLDKNTDIETKKETVLEIEYENKQVGNKQVGLLTDIEAALPQPASIVLDQVELSKKATAEQINIINIKAGLKKCQLYGFDSITSKIIIQEAIVNNVSIDNAILERIKLIKENDIKTKRGILREQIEYMGTHYFEDVRSVYYYLSEKLRFKLGFNMSAERAKFTKSNPPSYLDMITQENAFEDASNALREYADNINNENEEDKTF